MNNAMYVLYMYRAVGRHAGGGPRDDDVPLQHLLILVRERKGSHYDFNAARRIAQEQGWYDVVVHEAGVVDPTINDHNLIYQAKRFAMELGFYVLRYSDIFEE